jgi:hypothetical protein
MGNTDIVALYVKTEDGDRVGISKSDIQRWGGVFDFFDDFSIETDTKEMELQITKREFNVLRAILNNPFYFEWNDYPILRNDLSTLKKLIIVTDFLSLKKLYKSLRNFSRKHVTLSEESLNQPDLYQYFTTSDPMDT